MSVLEKKENSQEQDDADVFSDPMYVCKSSSLITSSLRNGAEVVQMPNGDLIISEVRRVTTQYCWISDKKQFRKVGSDL